MDKVSHLQFLNYSEPFGQKGMYNLQISDITNTFQLNDGESIKAEKESFSERHQKMELLSTKITYKHPEHHNVSRGFYDFELDEFIEIVDLTGSPNSEKNSIMSPSLNSPNFSFADDEYEEISAGPGWKLRRLAVPLRVPYLALNIEHSQINKKDPRFIWNNLE